MKSEDYKNNITQSLEDVISNINDMYYSIRKELRNEILNKKEIAEKIDEETNKIYDLLRIEDYLYLIKKKLPLRVRLFNKIIYCGSSIRHNGFIRIYFCFGDYQKVFQYDFSIEDIKELLKYIE